MGKETGIEWADATVNFWVGCEKVSAGCKACYMFRDMERWGKDPTDIHRTGTGTFNAALRWPEPKRIFTCSYSDFFIEKADAWRSDAWDIIRKTPQHTWMILTKRPERISQCLPPDWGDGWDNVWLGTTVENNASLPRITALSLIPAKTRFISFEPLLENLEFPKPFFLQDIHWAILGGESGNIAGKYAARPCKMEWIQDIIFNQCHPNNVKVFVKQLGSVLARELKLNTPAGSDIKEWRVHYLSDEKHLREFPNHLNK